MALRSPVHATGGILEQRHVRRRVCRNDERNYECEQRGNRDPCSGPPTILGYEQSKAQWRRPRRRPPAVAARASVTSVVAFAANLKAHVTHSAPLGDKGAAQHFGARALDVAGRREKHEPVAFGLTTQCSYR
jgi:hypothetical protein